MKNNEAVELIAAYRNAVRGIEVTHKAIFYTKENELRIKLVELLTDEETEDDSPPI
jgi:hypothetical protein